MCDVIPIDQLPDCDSCKDPTKRIAGKTFDVEGPGKVGLLYDCDNIVCKRKCNAIGSVIVRQVSNEDAERWPAELKPCPACGSDDCHTKRHYNRYSETWWGVKCYKCGFEKVSKQYNLPVDAMDAWNRRAEK